MLSTSGPVRVTGTLVLSIRDSQEKLFDIELPDRKVVLSRTGQDQAATALTALDGGFELIAPNPGVYRVCWELGSTKGCGGRIVVGRSTASAGFVRAQVNKPLVFGRVLPEIRGHAG